MLDRANYLESNIISKRILEPCFGNGAFLIQIVKDLGAGID